VIYQITPCPAPRQTQSDRWKKRPCVLRYRAFRDHVKALKLEVDSGDWIIFYIEMPKSWSKKKRALMLNAPHQQKPDVDNLCKSLIDSIYDDDAHIHDIRITKLWATAGGIEIRKNAL